MDLILTEHRLTAFLFYNDSLPAQICQNSLQLPSAAVKNLQCMMIEMIL